MRAKLYKNKSAVLPIAAALILGLALPACTCGEPATTEEPLTPGELSFEAAEYANPDYGFSIKYPNDWGESTLCGPTAVFCRAAGTVPLLAVNVPDVAEGTSFVDALTAALEGGGASEIEIVSQRETSLADGTPASEAVVKLKAQAFGADAFALGAMKDNNWVIVTVVTVGLLGGKYDEPLFSEIAHTLQFE